MYKNVFIYLVLLIAVTQSPAAFGFPQPDFFSKPAYAALKSTEAILEFEHFVEFLSTDAPSEVKSLNRIDEQLTYLFGSMSAQSQQASPKAEHKVTITAVEALTNNVYRVRYAYSGVVVLEGISNIKSYRVALPRRTDLIYSASQKGVSGNPCGDRQHPQSKYFWYFWNPKAYKCPLQAGIDFDYIDASVTRKANTLSTYPEYERLVNSSGEINIHMLFGMDDSGQSHDPIQSRDINAVSYRDIRQFLIDEGFVATKWTQDQITAVAPQMGWSKPYVETLSKQTVKGKIQVRLFFDSSAFSSDRAFAYFFKSALESSSMLIYSGHSGLGEYLDLEGLERNHGLSLLPGSQYQIYYFNSCNSYPYYNASYFARKNTKDLDIITNGLSTYFHTIGETNRALVSAVINWAEGRKKTSYQELAASMDSNNLLGVNGDEDNPTVD